jgi:hypothetical protein
LSNPITTNEVKNGPLTTTHQNGESTQDWILRHSDSVELSEPTGKTLTTTWTSANGLETIITVREPNETTESFLLRHIVDYTDAMVSKPPIP